MCFTHMFNNLHVTYKKIQRAWLLYILHVSNDEIEVGPDYRKVPIPGTRDQRILASLPKDRQSGETKLAEDMSTSLTGVTAIDIEAYRTNQEMTSY